MEISPKPPTTKGPAETFTGDVWVGPITRGLTAAALGTPTNWTASAPPTSSDPS
jgi:hypothetical protein